MTPFAGQSSGTSAQKTRRNDWLPVKAAAGGIGDGSVTRTHTLTHCSGKTSFLFFRECGFGPLVAGAVTIRGAITSGESRRTLPVCFHPQEHEGRQRVAQAHAGVRSPALT